MLHLIHKLRRRLNAMKRIDKSSLTRYICLPARNVRVRKWILTTISLSLVTKRSWSRSWDDSVRPRPEPGKRSDYIAAPAQSRSELWVLSCQFVGCRSSRLQAGACSVFLWPSWSWWLSVCHSLSLSLCSSVDIQTLQLRKYSETSYYINLDAVFWKSYFFQSPGVSFNFSGLLHNVR